MESEWSFVGLEIYADSKIIYLNGKVIDNPEFTPRTHPRSHRSRGSFDDCPSPRIPLRPRRREDKHDFESAQYILEHAILFPDGRVEFDFG